MSDVNPNESTAADTPSAPAEGYGIVDVYLTKKVKVFLHWGQSLRGVLVKRCGKFILLRNHHTRQECVVNLDWTSSTALDS